MTETTDHQDTERDPRVCRRLRSCVSSRRQIGAAVPATVEISLAGTAHRSLRAAAEPYRGPAARTGSHGEALPRYRPNTTCGLHTFTVGTMGVRHNGREPQPKAEQDGICSTSSGASRSWLRSVEIDGRRVPLTAEMFGACSVTGPMWRSVRSTLSRSRLSAVCDLVKLPTASGVRAYRSGKLL